MSTQRTSSSSRRSFLLSLFRWPSTLDFVLAPHLQPHRNTLPPTLAIPSTTSNDNSSTPLGANPRPADDKLLRASPSLDLSPLTLSTLRPLNRPPSATLRQRGFCIHFLSSRYSIWRRREALTTRRPPVIRSETLKHHRNIKHISQNNEVTNIFTAAGRPDVFRRRSDGRHDIAGLNQVHNVDISL